MARIQINVKAIKVIFNVNIKFVKGAFRIKKFKKRIVENKLIIRMLRYSAIKMRAKVPLLNSTLNPDTSSDSPSERSKGVRLVSARVVVNQIINIIISIVIYGTDLLIYIQVKSIDIIDRRIDRRIKDILIS